jgi:two-component system response regulator AtoC
MQRIYKLIGQVATTDSTVLIQGESGTGKELVARAIHRHSHRATSPLVSVNCAALPETLLEAELFGYEKGAFTGAAARRRGRFEIANGGSLLLDEVSEIPMALQVKLLRVLQERTMERLGAEESIALDLRVMASTNRNLAECVAEGTFREDLYYRLNVVSINLPPLRNRREDIPELCEFLMRKLGARRRLTASRLTEDALQYLIGLDWPGNVRQLEHTLERALVLSRGTPIGKEYLKLDAAGDSDAVLNSLDLREGLHAWVGRLEKNLILRALEAAEGNRSRAASMLKINRRLLYDKLKEHDLET